MRGALPNGIMQEQEEWEQAMRRKIAAEVQQRILLGWRRMARRTCCRTIEQGSFQSESDVLRNGRMRNSGGTRRPWAHATVAGTE